MKIDQYTQLYGIIGFPVRHSLSPLMHNTAFEALGINAVYLAFETMNLKGVIKAMKALTIMGMSVTIPHKTSIIPYLDELHPLAKQIGAVNTIVNHEGRLIGYNTDATGALAALERRVDMKGLRCLILGAGGAARSIGFALKGVGANLWITNRTASKAKALAEALGCGSIDWDEMGGFETDLIVQATPVGMAPHTNACPVPETLLKPGTVVMDIIYNPLETRLVKIARSRDCIVIDGLSMFVRQGVEQFRLWTRTDPPVSLMEKVVTEALKGHEDANGQNQKG